MIYTFVFTSLNQLDVVFALLCYYRFMSFSMSIKCCLINECKCTIVYADTYYIAPRETNVYCWIKLGLK